MLPDIQTKNIKINFEGDLSDSNCDLGYDSGFLAKCSELRDRRKEIGIDLAPLVEIPPPVAKPRVVKWHHHVFQSTEIPAPRKRPTIDIIQHGVLKLYCRLLRS
jgi:hypothetical protein